MDERKRSKTKRNMEKYRNYASVGELIFNMLVLTGTVKMADRVVHEMIGV